MTSLNHNLLKSLIKLAVAGATGEILSPSSLASDDWGKIIALAEEERVSSLVALALDNSPCIACPKNIRDKFRYVLRVQGVSSIIRKENMLRLIDQLEKEGIEVRILKGFALAECYAKPETRFSVDTDLLIDKKQERKAINFLRQKGFLILARSFTSHHSVCYHDEYGTVELHVMLFAELVQTMWQREIILDSLIIENPVTVKIDGYSVSTLGYTDHLIFVVLHVVKHLIYGSLSLRMILDIALFALHNKGRIDFVRFWNTMDSLQYTKLINNIIWTLIMCGGLDKSIFPGCTEKAPEQYSLILDEFIREDYINKKYSNLQHASGIKLNKQILIRNKGLLGYCFYMLRYRINTVANQAFPSREYLVGLYPSCLKHSFLVPAIRLHYAVLFMIKKVTAKTAEGFRDVKNDYSDIDVQARLAFLHELGLP